MTNGELIQRIQSLYSKGVQSDDTRLKPRHIYNALLTARSMVIRKATSIGDKFYQKLPCIEMTNDVVLECGCENIDICGAYKSIHKIPKIVSIKGNYLIRDITSVDGKMVFYKVEPDLINYINGYRYLKDKPLFFIYDDYLYVINSVPPRVVSMTAVFENPVDVLEFLNNSGCNPNCISAYDMEFPIDDEYIEDVLAIAKDELIRIFPRFIEDRTNDSKDSLKYK